MELSLFKSYLQSTDRRSRTIGTNFNREVSIGKEIHQKVVSHFRTLESVPVFAWLVLDEGASYDLPAEDFRAILDFATVLAVIEEKEDPGDLVFAKAYSAGLAFFNVLPKLNDTLVYRIALMDAKWRFSGVEYGPVEYTSCEMLLSTNLSMLRISETLGFE